MLEIETEMVKKYMVNMYCLYGEYILLIESYLPTICA